MRTLMNRNDYFFESYTVKQYYHSVFLALALKLKWPGRGRVQEGETTIGREDAAKMPDIGQLFDNWALLNHPIGAI